MADRVATRVFTVPGDAVTDGRALEVTTWTCPPGPPTVYLGLHSEGQGSITLSVAMLRAVMAQLDEVG